ncbi:MAG: hypothetical protein GC137_09875 [Alphaproteobacteria bacterium]|nr:hypothetical protein [Alphaproteobacteria bacterium]
MNKIVLTLACIFALFLAALGYYAQSSYIPKALEKSVLQSFQNFGLDNFQYKSLEHANGKIIITDIALDEEGFSTIEQIDVHFSLLKYLLNPSYADKIIINNLRLTGEISDELNLSIAGWPKGKSFLEYISKIPAKMLYFENGRIDLITPSFDGVSTTFDVHANLSDKTNINLKGRIKSKQKRLGFHGKISGKLSAAGHADINASLEQLYFLYNNVDARRGAGEVTVSFNTRTQSQNVKSDMNISSLRWFGFPLRDTKLVYEHGQNGYDILAEGKTFGPEDIEWTTHILHSENFLKTENTITPQTIDHLLDFLIRNKALDKKDAVPKFIADFQRPIIVVNTKNQENLPLSGNIDLIMNKPNIKFSGSFKADDTFENILGEYEAEAYKADDAGSKEKKATLSGLFKMNNISSTLNSQESDTIPSLYWTSDITLLSDSLNFGKLELLTSSTDFSLTSQNYHNLSKDLTLFLPIKKHILQKGSVNLSLKNSGPEYGSVRTDIYGGTIKSELSANSESNKLILANIRIADLLKDLGLRDILITGSLGGVIPYTLESEDKHDVQIKGAVLQSQGVGIIKFPDQLAKSLFPEDTPQMLTIREALKNYNYDFFEIRMDGEAAGSVIVSIRASGHNPNFKGGEIVDVDFQIETRPASLFQNIAE